MRDLYLNKIVDLTDPDCAFVKEFDHEIRKYGAVVYNHEYNSYQFIRHFEKIDYKRELLPDFLKVEEAGPLLNALTLSVHYEFDPATEDDPDNLAVWKELSQIELPVFSYDDDGEIQVDSHVKLYPSVSRHTVWFLSPASYDYVLDLDLLMIDPIIKNLQIAQTLIKKYGMHPFRAVYDQADLDSYEEPVLYGVTAGKLEARQKKKQQTAKKEPH